jgi:hypothetical protein
MAYKRISPQPTVEGGTGGIPVVTSLQTTLTPTLNANVGSILVSGTDMTTKVTGLAPLTFAITNSVVLSTSIVFVTVTQLDLLSTAVLEITGTQISASTITLTITNVGAGDTTANYNINFWVIN